LTRGSPGRQSVRVEWRAKAREDALDLAEYINIDSPAAAIAVLEEIHQQVAMLAEHPHMGRPGRVRGTRELVINWTPCVAAYQVAGDVVTILRVLHAARKWPIKL
jgi:toxin ParE1/3/4